MINLDHVDSNTNLACSRTCAACSHQSPYTEQYWLEPETLRSDLENLSKVAHFNTWFAVGGEPTINPKLVQFLEIARESGIANDIGVITNGDRLKRMGDDFWDALNVIRLSMYGEFDKSILEHAEKKCEEFNVQLDAWEYPFFFKQLKSVPDDGAESFKKCEWKNSCYTVHEGHFWRCPQSVFFVKRFLGHESTDGLALAGLTEEKLQAYLDRVEPFSACSICAASEKISFPWKESHSKAEWLKESTI